MLGWPGCCCGSDPGPTLGEVSFNVSGACPRGAAHPAMSVWTIQDGSNVPINTVQQIAFSPTTTGGTFRIEHFTIGTTANISWTSDTAVLAVNVYNALVALAALGPSDVSVIARGATVEMEFLGVRAGTNVSAFTVVDNSLTGTPHAITISTLQVGVAGKDEYQQLVLPYPPNGGTFKLAFDGQTTASITWAMSLGSPDYATIGANIDAALEALSNIPAGGVAAGGSDTMIQFTGALARTDVPQMTVAENLLTTSGFAQRRPPIAGATVTLYKDGVEESSGTTDADGNVRLPIYNPGTGFTVGVVAAGFYSGTNIVGVYGGTPAGTLNWGRNGGVRVELENPLTVPIKFFEHCTGRVDLPTSGDSYSLVGRVGTHAEGFTAAGVTDAAGIYIVEVPYVSPYDSLGSIVDHVIVHGPDKYACPVPPDEPSSEGSVNLLIDPCGNLPPDEWPG